MIWLSSAITLFRTVGPSKAKSVNVQAMGIQGAISYSLDLCPFYTFSFLTLLANLQSLIFSLMLFGWLYSIPLIPYFWWKQFLFTLSDLCPLLRMICNLTQPLNCHIYIYMFLYIQFFVFVFSLIFLLWTMLHNLTDTLYACMYIFFYILLLTVLLHGAESFLRS